MTIRPKKIPVVPVSDRPIIFNAIDRATLFSLGGCELLIQRAKMASVHCCHTNYWTKLPKFVHRKYASLVNIDVGTLLQIAHKKTRQNHEKNIQKKIYFRPTDPNFFTIWNRNHRYFLGLMIIKNGPNAIYRMQFIAFTLSSSAKSTLNVLGLVAGQRWPCMDCRAFVASSTDGY
jgi:hypothetical protein